MNLSIADCISQNRRVLIPDCWRNEFEKSINSLNLSRARLTAIMFIALEIMVLSLTFAVKGRAALRTPGQYYAAMHLIVLLVMPVFLYVFQKLRNKLDVSMAGVVPAGALFMGFILCWCAVISLMDQYYSGQIMVYVVAAMAIGVTPVFKPSVLLSIYLTVHAAFLFFLIYTVRDAGIPFGNIVNSTSFVLVSWGIAYMRYNRHAAEFMDQKLIAEKNAELERVNLELQEANRKLEILARIDGLTGIYNRTMFDRTIRAEWDRCRRHAMPLSLIMVDVDFFKAFNDRHGHQAGDCCLRRVADALSECARRASDSVARYGGEEFAVILPSVNLNSAGVLAEQMRKKVEELALPHPASRASAFLTISAGACTATPSEELCVEEFIENADRALYEAKKSHNSVAVREYGTGEYEQEKMF